MSSHTSIKLTVNGVVRTGAVPARTSLADFLRDHLGLTGTHLGCEQGVCGACNVFVDGLVVRSCLMLAAQANGAEVTTIEGLNPSEGLNEIQEAIARHSALQCGFCTPGFVVTLTEMLNENTEMSEEDVRQALSGNICRCTGYAGLVNAALELVRNQKGGE